MIDEPNESGFMYLMLKLHTDLFAGLPGMLFLGFMGLLFVAAIVSGVVLYKPFMRQLDFGTAGRQRPDLKWLDLHNLLGIVTVAWALTVGVTGSINTLSTLVLAARAGRADGRHGSRPSTCAPPLDGPASIRKRPSRTARGTIPQMHGRSFAAFPGSPFSSPHHYTIFMKGNTPETARLLRPVLADAWTGAYLIRGEMLLLQYVSDAAGGARSPCTSAIMAGCPRRSPLVPCSTSSPWLSKAGQRLYLVAGGNTARRWPACDSTVAAGRVALARSGSGRAIVASASCAGLLAGLFFDGPCATRTGRGRRAVRAGGAFRLVRLAARPAGRPEVRQAGAPGGLAHRRAARGEGEVDAAAAQRQPADVQRWWIAGRLGVQVVVRVGHVQTTSKIRCRRRRSS